MRVSPRVANRKESFNSKLVRLKEDSSREILRGFFWFQFQTGAIKSNHIRADVARYPSRFNSKLVRLKGGFRDFLVAVCARFQFQTGAIKSGISVNHDAKAKVCFNSKLVRLKVEEADLWGVSIATGFNSKLVRLKGGYWMCYPLHSPRFQFQTGAIKSIKLNRKPAVSFQFQFQTGAIKSTATVFPTGIGWSVSIPNWCD